MNIKSLTCKRMTAGLVYNPIQLQQPQVNRIYADITERYPFQTLQHLPDGARMANPTSDFFIQFGRMQVNDNVDYFASSKERALDLFQLAQARLEVPKFNAFGIKLVAFLTVDEGGNSAAILEESVFKYVEHNLALLGPGRQGAGLRIVLHQDGILELKIEPFFSDLTQLYVELDIQHPTPFTEVSDVEPWMDSAYDYLFREVQGFLETLE
ncbi:MAG: hypothetical protein GX139_07735 [Armatimonadetes bacterium]|nr:hypothetical protein [Armatimonadota bacterium]